MAEVYSNLMNKSISSKIAHRHIVGSGRTNFYDVESLPQPSVTTDRLKALTEVNI